MKRNNRHLSFPFRIAPDGRAAQTTSLEDHVRDEIVQMCLTNLSERLFLSGFGGNLRKLVFENMDDATSAMAKSTITQSLSNWLRTRIIIENLDFEVDNEKILFTLSYTIIETAENKTLAFERRLS